MAETLVLYNKNTYNRMAWAPSQTTKRCSSQASTRDISELPSKTSQRARKMSWVDTVKKDLKTYASITFDQCIDLAQNRKVCRSIVAKTVDVMS